LARNIALVAYVQLRAASFCGPPPSDLLDRRSKRRSEVGASLLGDRDALELFKI